MVFVEADEPFEETFGFSLFVFVLVVWLLLILDGVGGSGCVASDAIFPYGLSNSFSK